MAVELGEEDPKVSLDHFVRLFVNHRSVFDIERTNFEEVLLSIYFSPVHAIAIAVFIICFRRSKLSERLGATCCAVSGSSKCLRELGRKCPRRKSTNVLLPSTGQIFICLHQMRPSFQHQLLREIQSVERLPPELSGAFFSEKLLLLEEQRADA